MTLARYLARGSKLFPPTIATNQISALESRGNGSTSITLFDVPTSSVAFGGPRGHSLNWDLLAFCSGDDFTGAAAWTKAQGHQEVTTC
jgi:hypothetical protein